MNPSETVQQRWARENAEARQARERRWAADVARLETQPPRRSLDALRARFVLPPSSQGSSS